MVQHRDDSNRVKSKNEQVGTESTSITINVVVKKVVEQVKC